MDTLYVLPCVSQCPHNSQSLQNYKAADVLVKLVVQHYIGKDYIIITPYNAQRELIKRKLTKALKEKGLKASLADDCVKSVDTVQGQEADVCYVCLTLYPAYMLTLLQYIFFSPVRTFNPGFLSNKRRMNVALSRAKKQCIFIGHVDFFATGSGKKTLLGDFIRHFQKTVSVTPAKSILNGHKPSFMTNSASIATSGRRVLAQRNR